MVLEETAAEALALRAQTGDAAARSELIERAIPLARGLANRLCGSGPDSEDAEQEALLALLLRLSEWDATRSRWDRWAYYLMLHTIADHRRRLARWNSRYVPQAIEMGDDGEWEDQAIDRIAVHNIRWAIRALAELQRRVVILRYWSCMTYEEIGRTLGCTRQAVHQMHARALLSLRQMLA